MNSDDVTPVDDENELPPPAPERKILVWVAIVFAANVLCLLMLAARSNSSPELRSYFDVGILSCIIGVAILGIARVMFMFSFRLLDLFVMVVTLAVGMKGAIEGVRWLRGQHLRVFSDISEWALYAEACLIVGCALIGGAAMGLRNCRTLKVESPAKRALILVFGMMAFPAPIGLFTIPFHLLNQLLSTQETSLSSLAWIAALIGSAVITVSNSMFSIRGMALTTQNHTQETKWQEK